MKYLTKITVLFSLALMFLSAAPAQDIKLIADFENGFEIDGGLWQGNAVLTESRNEFREDNPENRTKFIKLDVSGKGKSELILTKFDVKEPSILSFRYRSELLARFGQKASLYIDGGIRASLDGVSGGWRTARVSVAPGEHSLVFETQNERGTKIVNGYNALYIDDITIFPDKVTAIRMFPGGEQNTYMGAEGSSRLRFRAEALLPDGSPKDSEEFTYTASGGDISKDGLWSPPAPGVFTVTASSGKLSVMSGRLIVHDADFMKKPFYYNGTGKTYNGYTGGARAEKAGAMPSTESLTITEPKKNDFEADAFFLIEGTVNRPKSKNHARILVRKNEGAKPLETWYILKDKFSRRIWLPFGKGEYHIELLEFDSAILTAPPSGEAMFRGGSYSQNPLTFTVYNTREEDSAVDGDGRWIYPSFNIQSDDFRVLNLLNDITAGIGGKREKILAAHDYIVSSLQYDTASFANASRSRKMDAISVIENMTAVCDGYSALSAALLRCAGIPCRIMVNRSILHSWNQVYLDGAWRFYDATWDDPVPDRGRELISHTYFLLDSLSGPDSRHRGAGSVVIGDVE